MSMQFIFDDLEMVDQTDYRQDSTSTENLSLAKRAANFAKDIFFGTLKTITDFLRTITALTLQFAYAFVKLATAFRAIPLVIALTALAAVARFVGYEQFATKCKNKIQAIVENSIKYTALTRVVLGVSFGVLSALEVFSVDSALSLVDKVFPSKLIVAVATIGAIWKDKVNDLMQNFMYKIGLTSHRAPERIHSAANEANRTLATHDRLAELAGAGAAAGAAAVAAPSLLAGIAGPAALVGIGSVVGKGILGSYREYIAEQSRAAAATAASAATQPSIGSGVSVAPPPVAASAPVPPPPSA